MSALLLTSCALLAAAPSVATIDPQAQVSEDWGVYQAVVKDLGLQPSGTDLLLCEPDSRSDDLPLDLARHEKVLVRDLQVELSGRMQPATLINFRDRNQSDVVSPANFPASSGLVFLDDEDLNLISGEGDSLQAVLQQRYPGAVGLVAFSFVGYNQNHDQALVYVRYPGAAGTNEKVFLLLEESAGRWQVIQRTRIQPGSSVPG